VAILNIQDAREWLGRRLGQKGPVSQKRWKKLKKQGLPIGAIGDAPTVETDELERWLIQQAGQGRPSPKVTASSSSQPPEKRKRGRPRKFSK